MAQGDRPCRRPQARLAPGIEALQHLRRGEPGQQLAERCIESERTLLDQLHCRHRGDRLGHGGDPEHGIEAHGCVVRQAAPAERALVHNAARVGRGRDHARYRAAVDRLLQRPLDPAGLDHVSPPARPRNPTDALCSLIRSEVCNDVREGWDDGAAF